MNARSIAISTAALMCCCFLACNGKDNVGSKYAKTQQVQALNGGTVSVTSSDDPYLAGTVVQIPPGALDQDTLITVAEGAALSLHDGAKAGGPVAEFGPASATFIHPVTVTLPYQLDSGLDPSGLAVQGVDGNGQVITVAFADLKIDAVNHTLAFTTRHLIRYAALWSGSGGTVCPQGEVLCGCCGNGTCQPAGQPCPPYACPGACGTGGGGPGTGGGSATGGGNGGGPGTGGGGGGSTGGGSCCPAGETWCGCGNVGSCIPAGQACPLACPQPAPGSTATDPTCCGPGTYLCGCGGQGTCVPDTQACPLSCPVCDPTTAPSPCGCLPPGAVCQCDPNSPSTVPCQCDPNQPVTSTGQVCVVDAGSPCASNEVLTACGCLPPGAICATPDAGTGGGCSSTEQVCCDGQCVGPGQACPSICFSDGGVSTIDGGVCGPNTSHCPNGTCVSAGVACGP